MGKEWRTWIKLYIENILFDLFYLWKFMMFSRVHLLYMIWTYMTRGTRICMYGLWVGIITIFNILGHFLFHGGSELTLGLMTYILFDSPWHKEQENILSNGEDPNWFQVIWSFSVSWGSQPLPKQLKSYIPIHAARNKNILL